MKTNQNNCLLLYGGGLCDCAGYMMRSWADALQSIGYFDRVFVGFNSFASTQDTSLIEEWSPKLKKEAESNHGGFFGTSRSVMMTDPAVRAKAIDNLRAMGIIFVGVLGGDGSSRCLDEISDSFHLEGITWSFLMPATIDGIQGGRSFGLKPAVRASCYIIEQLASTCLQTLNVMENPCLIVELQGRNRDDILAHVVQKISLGEVNFGRTSPRIVAIPANYETSIKELIALKDIEDPLLILISEGSKITKGDVKVLLKGKKIRSFEVAHLSQMNGATTREDKDEISKAIELAKSILLGCVRINIPFSLVYDNDGGITVAEIGYYAKLNPANGQNPTLDPDLEKIVRKYLV